MTNLLRPPRLPRNRLRQTTGKATGRDESAYDLRDRLRRARAGGEEYAAGNLASWQPPTADEIAAFLAGQIRIIHSGNVAAVQYHPQTQELTVHYRRGGAYRYSKVTPEKALEFAVAPPTPEPVQAPHSR